MTITGTNFTAATGVDFGTALSAAFTVVSSSKITATDPAGTPYTTSAGKAGSVDVTVVTPGGTSAVVTTDHFTYVAAPTVGLLSLLAGPLTGGSTETITGTNFTGATAVDFNTTKATNLKIVSSSKITVTIPKGQAGRVDVTVVTAGGTSVKSSADKFTYVALPTVTGIVAPSSGPLAGGNQVTINGTNLLNATSVKFGSSAATNLVINSAGTQITVTDPTAGKAGTVDVTVATAGGTSATSTADKFTYAAAPTITGIKPAAGAVGASVTITAANLLNATVDFGNAAATSITSDTATQIVVKSPAGTGTVNVTVTTPSGNAVASSAFTYSTTAAAAAVSNNGPVAAEANDLVILGLTDQSDPSAMIHGEMVANLMAALLT